MPRPIGTAFAFGLILSSLGCSRSAPPTQTEPKPTAVTPPPTTRGVPPAPAPVLTADRLTGKTFIYNHSLVDGSLEGNSVRFAADGKLTGANEQKTWKLEGEVLTFLDENGAVRTRFDKAYSGPAGLFLLGHRTSDNKYHTLIELPPTK